MAECPSTIAGLQQAIAQDRITAGRAIELQRLGLLRADHDLNAIVDVLPAQLMPAAATGPLAGVGLAHKDIFDLPGRAPGLGRGYSMDLDIEAPGRPAATVLERLSRHGATHLATLAMAEYACGATGDNPHLAVWPTAHSAPTPPARCACRQPPAGCSA
jgi:Asp-tRNA(Asn)/Glu-tRNA(Gln) amidotransferase A subunit family amidase